MLKNILYISIFTAIVVASSALLSIYHSIKSNETAPDSNIQISPIPPTFDSTTVNSLNARLQVAVDLSAKLTTATIAATPQFTPTLTTTPTASISPQISLPINLPSP